MPPPPYRADQVGSLIRPKYLNDANTALKQFSASEQDNRDGAEVQRLKDKAEEAEKKAIKEAIDEQIKRGVFPITSGEFERQIFYGGFFEALDGIDIVYHDLSKFRTDLPTDVSYEYNVGSNYRFVQYD